MLSINVRPVKSQDTISDGGTKQTLIRRLLIGKDSV